MIETTCPLVYLESIGGVTVVTLAEADLIAEEIIYDLDDQLKELVAALNPPRLLLNFREVRSMSSTMLAVLLKHGRRVTGLQGRLKLCCIAPDLFEVFKITRFDRLFEIFDEEAAALDSF